MRPPALFSTSCFLTRWLPLLSALLLLALYYYATATGLSGTGDSRFYLFAAHSWRESGRLLNPDGTPYRFWPPLFPLLLSGAGTVARLRALHAACLAGSLLLWSAAARQVLPVRRAAVVPVLLAFSTSALALSKFVWAETVFGLLWAGYVWALLHWRRTGSRTAFWLSAGFGFLMPLQRANGMFLLLGVGAALLLERRRAGRPGRAIRLGHAGLALAGAMLWFWRVRQLPGPEILYTNLGLEQLLSSLADYGFVLGRWLLPLAAGWRPAVAAGAWATGLLGLLIALWPRTKSFVDAPVLLPTAPQPAFDDQDPATALRLLWAGAVACLLLLLLATVFSRSAAGVDDSERYVSVLYPVVVLLTLHNWPSGGSGWLARRVGPVAWRWLSRALLLAWLLYANVRTLHNARRLYQLPPTEWLPTRISPE